MFTKTGEELLLIPQAPGLDCRPWSPASHWQSLGFGFGFQVIEFQVSGQFHFLQNPDLRVGGDLRTSTSVFETIN